MHYYVMPDTLLNSFFLNEIQFICSVVLVSGVQQSDSVIYIYIRTHICIFFFIFFSLRGYYKILSIVPCAISRSLLFILYIVARIY